MKQFIDKEGKKINFTYRENSFEREPEHVLVVCSYEGKWLLTKHKERGLEFPGGKREPGETLEEAACREVMEETGAILRKLSFVGEYKVTGSSASFIKRIYHAEIQSLWSRSHYFETEGPVLRECNLLTERFGEEYSFIMKDDVMKFVLLQLASNMDVKGQKPPENEEGF
ncbi:RNA deprotection pyrophosphohydrolase [Bacillus massilinigeriensis]|uniref:RNA deprotection pyrophosphohydrolase n=1 Tax=Bacillus mediterraneensis TaxID=1805474 RepID=UPI0008F8F102|nr:nucleoside triphosphatase YtkD [Bacillus mediterraneensis]